MFTRNNTILLVIDMQERLLPKIEDSENLTKNTAILIQCCKILNLPALVTEQYPEGVGPTVSALLPDLDHCPKISKKTFSCLREPLFRKTLESAARKQIIIAGIETHVCVFQTAADLIQEGYEVQVVQDAVGSRTSANKKIGLERMRSKGVDITSMESVVFELLETSVCAEFKQVLRLIK
jgi:nicotinamidase-related amidase